MSNVLPTKKIYIDLDSILDTRLGTLNKIDIGFGVDISSRAEYYTRKDDHFISKKYGDLAVQNYNKIRAAFLQDILALSPKTKMYVFLRELCATVYKLNLDSPTKSTVELDINLYPYKVTDKERDLIITAVSHHLGDFFKVNCVHVPMSALSVPDVQMSYTAMVMYDYGTWLNMHHKDVQKKKLKEITLYCPMLNFIRPITAEEEKEFADKNMTVYQFLTFLMTDFITLQFLPISLFCADTPLNAVEYYKPTA